MAAHATIRYLDRALQVDPGIAIEEKSLREYFGLDAVNEKNEFKYPIWLYDNGVLVPNWKVNGVPAATRFGRINFYQLIARVPTAVNVSHTFTGTNNNNIILHNNNANDDDNDYGDDVDGAVVENEADADADGEDVENAAAVNNNNPKHLLQAAKLKLSVSTLGADTLLVVEANFTSSVLNKRLFQKSVTFGMELNSRPRDRVQGVAKWSPQPEAKTITARNEQGWKVGLSATGGATPTGGITAEYSNTNQLDDSQRNYWSTLVLLPSDDRDAKIRWTMLHDHRLFNKDFKALKNPVVDHFDDLSVSSITKDFSAQFSFRPEGRAADFVLVMEHSAQLAKKAKKGSLHHTELPPATHIWKVRLRITKRPLGEWTIEVRPARVQQQRFMYAQNRLQ